MKMFIISRQGVVHLLRADGTTCPNGTRNQHNRVMVTDLQCRVYGLAPCGYCWPQSAEYERNINRRIR